jgi:hypothetical protein
MAGASQGSWASNRSTTAEVTWDWGPIDDPYEIYPPHPEENIGPRACVHCVGTRYPVTTLPAHIFSAISEIFEVEIVLEQVLENELTSECDNELLEEISHRARGSVRNLDADFCIANSEEEIFAQVQLINVWIGLNLVQEDSSLLRPERATELLAKIRAVSERMSNAILHAKQVDDYIAFLERKGRCGKIGEEDQEEGPIDRAFVFKSRNDGIVVAMERPDAAERRRAPPDDVPF